MVILVLITKLFFSLNSKVFENPIDLLNMTYPKFKGLNISEFLIYMVKLFLDFIINFQIVSQYFFITHVMNVHFDLRGKLIEINFINKGKYYCYYFYFRNQKVDYLQYWITIELFSRFLDHCLKVNIKEQNFP